MTRPASWQGRDILGPFEWWKAGKPAGYVLPAEKP